MITIRDEQKTLNLNPKAIYLMLTSDEMAEYRNKLKNLNRCPSLTRKLFRFEIVEKGVSPYEKLSDDMKYNVRHYNVLVRLVNSIHNIYCYGMGKIDFDKDKKTIVDKLNSFVDSVCKENIMQLDILCQRPTSTSLYALKQYRDNNIVKEIFEAALSGEVEESRKANEDLQKSSPSPDLPTSMGLVQSLVDGKKEKEELKIEKERCERESPSRRPKISFEVKMVPTGKKNRDGREKKKRGVEITIDGVTVPVWFGSTDQTFLYVATLKACMEGRPLKRSFFTPLQLGRNEEENRNKERDRKEIKEWLRTTFSALFFDKKFDYWYNGVREDPHPLDVAIPQIRQKLWNFLYPQHEEAYYYCFVVNKNGQYIIRATGNNNVKIADNILR